MAGLSPDKPIVAKKPLRGRNRDSAHLEAVFASIGEGVIATNSQGLITRANQAALDMLGFTAREITGKHFPEVVVALYENGSKIDILDRPIIKAYMTGQTVSDRTIYRKKDDTLLPVMVTVSPIIFRKKPVGAIEVFRDLSSEIENEKLKSDFISIASHQLRTPLSAVNMYTRMLQDGMAGDLNAQQKEFTTIVLSSVERMNELIDTLLNITRIEAGGLSIRSQDVQFDELLRVIVAEFQPLADEKNITFTQDFSNNVPQITSDSLLLREVCANLLSNAIKYTPPQGTVHAALSVEPTRLLFTVRDTGYGIPEAAQKNIFSKFFRAPNIATQDVSGTGLGLYLTRAIAESLHAELGFESQENVGTTFYFSLPLRKS